MTNEHKDINELKDVAGGAAATPDASQGEYTGQARQLDDPGMPNTLGEAPGSELNNTTTGGISAGAAAPTDLSQTGDNAYDGNAQLPGDPGLPGHGMTPNAGGFDSAGGQSSG